LVDDLVDSLIALKESDDAHVALALGTDQGIDLINLPDHLGPAFGENAPERLPLHPPALFLQFDDRTIVATLSFDKRTVAA